MKDIDFKISEKQLEFSLKTKIYSLPAIYQAAYFFLDKVYVLLDGDPQKEIKVIMKLKTADNGSSSVNLDKIAGEFHNELLNQLLREKVGATNAKIREYIVSQALYNAVPNEVDELLKEVEEEDWQDDPLGISKPWESSSASDSAKAMADKKASEDKENIKGKKRKPKSKGKK